MKKMYLLSTFFRANTNVKGYKIIKTTKYHPGKMPRLKDISKPIICATRINS